MKQGLYSFLSPITKLVLLIAFALLLSGISSIIVGLIAQPLFQVDINSETSMHGNIGFIQFYQAIQSICLFIVPSLLAFYLFQPNFKNAVNGSQPISMRVIFLMLILILWGQGFISLTGWLNQQVQLPEIFGINEWINNKEKLAEELTGLILNFDNWKQATITIGLICVLPAIGEEWFFRGVIQTELNSVLRNKHLAIVLTAILFSAIHLQFLTFLPRLFLGIILGYLYIYSGSLWISVMAHFANNLLAVIAYSTVIENDNPDISSQMNNPFGIYTVMSIGIIIGCLYYIKKITAMNYSS